MRITDAEGKPLHEVYLGLSDDEAELLIDALIDLAALDPARKGWHSTACDADGERCVTIYREGDETALDVANPS